MKAIRQLLNIGLLFFGASLLMFTKVQAGSIYRYVYTGTNYSGIPGTAVINLTTNASFPSFPDPSLSSELIQDTFDYPVNISDNYGDQSEGFLTAPETGNYVFWLASDDNSELWLSTDANPVHRVLIASVPGYTTEYQWNKYGSQQSTPIPLVKGNSYYLQVLHKDATGGDNVAVGWQKPDGLVEQPMPTMYYQPYSITNLTPIITKNPQDATAEDGHMVTFR